MQLNLTKTGLGRVVDGLTVSAARALRTAVRRALTRSVGAKRAVEVDIAFHGPSRRLGPAERRSRGL